MDKSSADIANEIAVREQDLKAAINNQAVIEQETLLLSKEILVKQGQKKDLEYSLSKASHIVKDITIDLRTLRGKFWAAKNEGL